MLAETSHRESERARERESERERARARERESERERARARERASIVEVPGTAVFASGSLVSLRRPFLGGDIAISTDRSARTQNIIIHNTYIPNKYITHALMYIPNTHTTA
jgi:hypothetical protein